MISSYLYCGLDLIFHDFFSLSFVVEVYTNCYTCSERQTVRKVQKTALISKNIQKEHVRVPEKEGMRKERDAEKVKSRLSNNIVLKNN